MDSVLQEQIKITVSKIEIALGWDASEGRYRARPNIERAQKILDDLQTIIEATDDESPLELLKLRPRLCGKLIECGVFSVEQLAVMTDEELLQVPQISHKSLEEIHTRLSECGLR
jgi:DNA-directed RNA polymerase alpha subunit